MRIRHVIPTVGGSAPEALIAVQDITLQAVERALRCADPDHEIDVRAVRFPDEPLDRNWLTDLPILERSILDLGDFDLQRRLPLLSDVLTGFGDPAEFDLAVLTNVDIAPQPLFYDLVAEIHSDGFDAFSITRRTVQPRFARTSLARLAASAGTVHPGHDCFVFASRLLDRLQPVDVALGVRWVARVLLWQLQLGASRFRHFGDLHATFHLGDDRVWTDPRLAQYERYNEARALELVERLVGEYGLRRVSRLFGVKPFIEALDKQAAPKSRPPRRRTFTVGHRPLTGGAPRMVFSANTGRSGSKFLANLLTAAPGVAGGHECEPSMTGPWLRRVAYEPPAASYDDRLVKVDALRAELRQLPPNSTYVDTSHMFVKTFADVVFDEFQHQLISVVVLRRDPLATARSFFALDYLGPRPRAWYDWMIPPTAPQAMFRLDPQLVESQFDLIFGYLVDIDVRTQRLRELTPAVNWVDTRLEEVSTPSGARALFRAIGLTPPDDLDDRVRGRVNTKATPKRRVEQTVSEVFVREQWCGFLERHGERDEVSAFVHSHGMDGS